MNENKRNKIIIAAGMAVFVAFWGTIAVFKYLNGGYNGLDLAIYNNTFWNTVHGQLFASSINIPSYLGDHAEWLILPLCLIYAAIPHPFTLIVLQILGLAVCAIPIYLIAKEILTEKKYAFIFPLAWLLNFTVCYNTLWEFHMLVFSLVFVFFAAYYFIKKRFWLFLLFLFLGFLAREDVTFVSIGFALVYLADPAAWRKGERVKLLKWALVPAVLGALVFFTDIKIISAMNADGVYKYIYYFHGLGHSVIEIVLNALLHPVPIFQKFVSLASLKLMLAAVMVFLFLPLRRPRFLLLCPASYIIISTANSNDWFLPLQTHYALLIFPGIVIAAIYGFQSLMSDKREIIPKPLLAPLTVFAPIFFLFALGPLQAIPLVFTDSPDARAEIRAEALIPADASVSSSFTPATVLSGREKFYYFYYEWSGKNEFSYADYSFPELPDYLLINDRDFRAYSLGLNKTTRVTPSAIPNDKRFKKLINDGDYKIIFEENNVALLKKGGGNGEYPFMNLLETLPANATKSSRKIFSGLNLLGYKKNADGWRLYLSVNGPLGKYTVIKINDEILPLGQGLLPPEKIPVGKIIEYNYTVPTEKINFAFFTATGSFNLLRDETARSEFTKLVPLGEEASLP
jgi:uncharacterized membrane protein